jgi:hypothetical protein
LSLRKKRKALFKEGARLHYLSTLLLIISELSGHGYEDIVAKRLAERGKNDYQTLASMKLVGKIRSDRTVWDYIGNAEALGLVLTSGRSRVTKGGTRARYLSLTACGEAISFVRRTLASPVELPRLPQPEKVLYFKRFLEIDHVWNGFWFRKVISSVPEDELVSQTELIRRIADATGLSKDYKPSAVIHRVSPKVQWLCDLDLIMADQDGRRYRLTDKGSRLRRCQKDTVDPALHYEVIAHAYDLKVNPVRGDMVWVTLRSVYRRLISLYDRPPHYVSIATLRYLVGALLLLDGYLLEDSAFDSNVMAMREAGQLDLASSPPTSAMGEPIVSSRGRFDLITVRA